MSEQLAARVPEPLRRMMGSLICVLPLCGIAGVAGAQTVPPGLRACAAESDSARRLACYDREMARLLARPAPQAAAPQGAAPTPAKTVLPSSTAASSDAALSAGSVPPPNAAVPPSSGPPLKADLSSGSVPPPKSDRPSSSAPPVKANLASGSASAQAPRAAVATSAPPQPASQEASAPHRASVWKNFIGGGSSRVTAHVASLDRWPDAMVLHLDNGQVWQQVGRASGDLSLQVGDSVTIEKHFGSYWLSSLHVSDMQVRLKPQ